FTLKAPPTQININGLCSGFYIIKINTCNGLIMKKLILP
ncbi:MAG: T9SS type A sorting domain-containing protein, partial [Bacteroidia bacterium]|nr:T9SS type A sorting domain-containing protein [Bacteroidia bacterium]